MKAVRFWAAYLVLLILGVRAFSFLFGWPDQEYWEAWHDSPLR